MISVCMATFNGEKYLREQLDSILSQVSKYDEVIISDDGSTDATAAILQEYSEKYPCIRVIEGPKRGVIKNFENAIIGASGEFIFLSDQDDIWTAGKIEKVLRCFENPRVNVVVHDANVVDGAGRELESSFYMRRRSRAGFIKNIVMNSYLGCSMAFRATMKAAILPMPDRIEMHDWWIGMISEIGNHSVFIPDKLLHYRRHGNNVSSFQHHPFKKMLFNRLYLLYSLFVRKVVQCGVGRRIR